MTADLIAAEIRAARSILAGLRSDMRRFDENWPKSKRGSRLQDIWNAMQNRAQTAEQCADDALKLLADITP